ncbi:MAG TPA: hypothetical protein PK098_13210, partial [Phycisphaerales bacterium]|nr:hypothetical protein [Phycisphaerales bacterium]
VPNELIRGEAGSGGLATIPDIRPVRRPGVANVAYLTNPLTQGKNEVFGWLRGHFIRKYDATGRFLRGRVRFISDV